MGSGMAVPAESRETLNLGGNTDINVRPKLIYLAWGFFLPIDISFNELNSALRGPHRGQET